jgi:hypothetical protein
MKTEVPKALKVWFMIHCVVDLLFAIPLMVFPGGFLTLLGWRSIDPIASRLVAAALFGIGIESGLAWTAPADAYRAMLGLKIIWSVAAVVGLLWSLIAGAFTIPAVGVGLLVIFVLFNILWIYWKRRL